MSCEFAWIEARANGIRYVQLKRGLQHGLNFSGSGSLRQTSAEVWMSRMVEALGRLRKLKSEEIVYAWN